MNRAILLTAGLVFIAFVYFFWISANPRYVSGDYWSGITYPCPFAPSEYCIYSPQPFAVMLFIIFFLCVALLGEERTIDLHLTEARDEE